MNNHAKLPILIATLLASPLMGQLNRGTLTGLVTDPTQGVIADAKIVAENKETNSIYTTTSTSSGNYDFPALPIGAYRVTAEVSGFKRAVQEDVVLSAGATVRLDIVLALGSVTESVEVKAETTPIQSENARFGTNINNKLVEGLPLSVSGQVRNVFNLAVVAPEAKTASQFRIGGGRNAGWDMLMDGMSLASGSTNYQAQRAPLSSVSIDAISEFTVNSSGMKAEYGRAMGIISFVTKSGTNQFHGNAFEFLRNNAFDARGFFAARTPVLKQNDFGGTFGGPVIVPRIYNGKDKSFFFASYEGFRSREADAPTYNTVPLAGMYQGDFSGWVTNAGATIPLYDPASTRPNAAGTGFVRDPYPGNQVSPTRFSQVAGNYLGIRPESMVPNQAGPRLNYFQPAGGFTHPWNKGSIRADHRLTQKDSLSFLFLKSQWEDLFLNGIPPGLPVPLNGQQSWARKNTSGRFSWDRAISSRILNSLRVSYQRESGDLFDPTSFDPPAGWAAKLGVKNVSSVDRGVPQITMADYTTWSSTTGWAFDRGKNVNIANDLSWISGSHSFKGGFFYSRDRWDGGGENNPGFDFSFLATASPGDQSRNSGNAFASFLLGYPGGARVDTPRLVAQIWRYYGGFFQDDWKVTRKLTVNLGLRYEYTHPVTGGAAVNGELTGFSNFSPTTPNPAAGGRVGALIFSGDGPNQTGKDTMFDGWPWAFSPRLGIAYQLRPGTVIRTSGGRSFEAIKTTGGSTRYAGFTGSFLWNSSDLQINDFPTTLDRGIPAWPTPPFLTPDVANNQASVDYWRTDAGRPSEFWTWTFDIQQRLSSTSVLSVGYSGSKGTHLTSNILNINQLDPSLLDRYGSALLRGNASSPAAAAAGIQVPFAGFNGTVQQALQAYPQYKNIATYNGGERLGNSTYHALVAKVDKRYSNGLTGLASYTLSKMLTDSDSASLDSRVPLNQYNGSLEKSLSNDDQTHVARFATEYELPVGRGKRFDPGPLASQLAGGWSIGAFLEYASGLPRAVSPGVNPPIYPGGGGNRVFISSYDNWRATAGGSKFDPFEDSWWNRSAFQQVPQSLLDNGIGNATRTNGRARSAPYLNENVSLGKTFAFKERIRVQFRLEGFNLFNRVRLGSPDSTFTSQNFGLVRSQGNTPRQIQLGLKVNF